MVSSLFMSIIIISQYLFKVINDLWLSWYWLLITYCRDCSHVRKLLNLKLFTVYIVKKAATFGSVWSLELSNRFTWMECEIYCSNVILEAEILVVHTVCRRPIQKTAFRQEQYTKLNSSCLVKLNKNFIFWKYIFT